MDFGGDTAYVFIAMIVLSDDQGFIKHTENSLARLICKPVEAVREAILNLEAEDSASNIKANNGRRIVPLRELMDDETRGWMVVNKEVYRDRASHEDKKKADRERIAEKRKKNKDVANCRNESHLVADVAYTDTDTDTDTSTPNGVLGPSASPGAALPACPHQQIIALYHELLPTCPQVVEWTEAREKSLRARWRERAVGKKGYKTLEDGLAYWRRFFSYVAESEFLTGKSKPQPGKPPFLASLEWLITAGNFVKIIEGTYHR